MNKEVLLPLMMSFIAGSSTIIGFLLSFYFQKSVKSFSYIVMSLAAGVLMGTAFFSIIPESYYILGENVFLWLLAGFVLFFMIEVFLGFHACVEEDTSKHNHVLGVVAGVGIFFHSLLDGIAIALAYKVDANLGFITATAIMLHELPEGIFTFSILLNNNLKVDKAVKWTIAVALATPFGTLLAISLFPNFPREILGMLLAMAGGSFLYIAASDLIPETHKSRSTKISIFFLIGLAFTWLLGNFSA